MRILLLVIAVGYALHGFFMLFDPRGWYDAVPGVSMLGPYNTHFIRDVAIVYLVTAGAFVWGVRARSAGALLVASAWPALHAVYHLQMWAARGFALDTVALVNMAGIQAPAWLALWAAIVLKRQYRR